MIGNGITIINNTLSCVRFTFSEERDAACPVGVSERNEFQKFKLNVPIILFFISIIVLSLLLSITAFTDRSRPTTKRPCGSRGRILMARNRVYRGHGNPWEKSKNEGGR